ncbi:transcriptional regulator, ArsR family [Albimonas donghaensis]|uniref:Transcriptional regulator, ArsR family n=1 Tax=Albimonas donghaensis TaxID=356660 RepID=A0A1H2RK53_9RHOB|nr:metalloregulator ArsR/SmtB family transcription factor [Albimonas donghaensis]SDW19019.1 transcriptional regulator, ArsR family [Albimonas donghaensis]
MTLSPGLADSRINVSPSAMDVMDANADEATALLKALAHEGRLRILCHLVEGEKSVTELERLISARQSAVSQQLSRLRLEGLVENRREGKTIFYRIADPRAARILMLLHDIFCGPEAAETSPAGTTGATS